MAEQIDDDLRERLKSSLWFSLGKLVDEESAFHNRTATPQFIGAMTEMVWAQIENTAQDLESFSRHAGRTTVTTDDVLLMTRRNEALEAVMRDFMEKEEAGVVKGKGGKGKMKAKKS